MLSATPTRVCRSTSYIGISINQDLISGVVINVVILWTCCCCHWDTHRRCCMSVRQTLKHKVDSWCQTRPGKVSQWYLNRSTLLKRCYRLLLVCHQPVKASEMLAVFRTPNLGILLDRTWFKGGTSYFSMIKIDKCHWDARTRISVSHWVRPAWVVVSAALVL